MAAMARKKTPRSPAISGRGRFIGRMYARTANFPLRRRLKIRHGPGREALPTFGLVNSRPGTFRAAPSQSAANEMRACCAIQRSSRMPGLSLGVPSVRPRDAIENVDPRLGGCFWSGRLCSSFLLIPRCTKTDANTAAIFRYEFNACGLQRTADR
jgi:hypothetical protein